MREICHSIKLGFKFALIGAIFSLCVDTLHTGWFSKSRINRIHHWCSVGTGKPQLEGPAFQWETRLVEFHTGTGGPEG